MTIYGLWNAQVIGAVILTVNRLSSVVFPQLHRKTVLLKAIVMRLGSHPPSEDLVQLASGSYAHSSVVAACRCPLPHCCRRGRREVYGRSPRVDTYTPQRTSARCGSKSAVLVLASFAVVVVMTLIINISSAIIIVMAIITLLSKIVPKPPPGLFRDEFELCEEPSSLQ